MGIVGDTGAEVGVDTSNDTESSHDSDSLCESLVIEAEDYVSWYDATAGNQPGEYRNDDVDVELCFEGGYNIGWTEAGEWLEYEFEIQSDDLFHIVIRVASAIGKKAGLKVQIDGKDICSAVDVPNTGAWQSWGDLPIENVSLGAGKHILRLNLDSQYNVDYIYIHSATTACEPLERAGFGSSPTAPAGYIGAARKHGSLQVIGTQLCDEGGTPFQFRGMSTHGIQWFPTYPGHTLYHLAYDWGIDIVRPAMYVEDYKDGAYWAGYMAQPEYMTNKVIEVIEEVLELGIYVIVDWHLHNDPNNFTNEAVSFFLNRWPLTTAVIPMLFMKFVMNPKGFLGQR